MAQKKKLQELTIKDNFMFGAVMMEEENCKAFLELALGIPIKRVEVSKEKSIIYHPEYKGVRLDVYAKDGNNTRYNVEMQVTKKEELGKRDRYYHSQIDMELLLSGSEYKELPNAYVIFICNFDPFGEKKYRYTLPRKCIEAPDVELNDGSVGIYLSTQGENDSEVPKELVKFLKYVKADLHESENDFEDDFVKKLQETVRKIKRNREMEERYMVFKEMMQEERGEGRALGRLEGKIEAIFELLEDLGEVSEELRNRIQAEKELNILNRWLKLASKSDSMEEFIRNM